MSHVEPPVVASIKSELTNALSFAAQAPGAESTWLMVRQIAEHILLAHWYAGALHGDKPDKAFFVRCGPGTTMTQLDIDTGRLIVEVGLAPIKPAEFIIFRIEELGGLHRLPFNPRGPGI